MEEAENTVKHTIPVGSSWGRRRGADAALSYGEERCLRQRHGHGGAPWAPGRITTCFGGEGLGLNSWAMIGVHASADVGKSGRYPKSRLFGYLLWWCWVGSALLRLRLRLKAKANIEQG